MGCVPPACWPYPNMHCTGGGCLPRGCVWGDVCLGGLPKEVSARGGVCRGGDVYSSMQWGRFPLWTDRHLWKHNLRKLRLRVVKNGSHYFNYLCANRQYGEFCEGIYTFIFLKVFLRCFWGGKGEMVKPAILFMREIYPYLYGVKRW